METRVYLGRVKAAHKDDFIRGEPLYLDKHEWSCGWYWALGWIGNKDMHTHFDRSFLRGSLEPASEIFSDPTVSDKDWWVVRDLFVQAYALRAAAEVYRYGGHQANLEGVTDLLKSQGKSEVLNRDLELTLNTLWTFLTVTCGLKELT